MATTFEPLSRSTSGDSARSHSSIQLLSNSSSSELKGRHADVGATSGDVERASISMPPPAIKPNLRYQNMSPRSPSTQDSAILNALGGHQDNVMLPPSLYRQGVPNRRSEEPSPSIEAGETSPDSAAMRRSDPEVETKRRSFASLYNPGKSAPSSVAGGSEQDGSRSHSAVTADETDKQTASSEASNRATTATNNLTVTAFTQNGALSPSLSASLREPFATHLAAQSNVSGTPMTSPSSPTPNTAKDGRTFRGRTTAASRRVSNSNPASASASADRSTASEKNPNRVGTIGICALDSKARSKPSRSILNRLVGKDNDFDVIIFGDKVILDENVENWPVCDFLISFFSDGFPLEKAIAYAKLRRPFCVNDLPMQTILWDRRLCLLILDELGVPTPARIEVNRDGGPVVLSTDIAQRMYQLTGVKLKGSEDGRGGGQPPPKDIRMEDDNDTLIVDGRRLSKPFVEKPVSGEDHNINIYYPKSQGGGGRRLFRKVNNKSSEKDETLTIPQVISETETSYVYEQFLKVENAEDVKAYTVGPDFCHAETRKSPVVDGVVKRNPNGKEVRYVTSLTKEEQIMAAKIAQGFGQRVCGFDLLRVDDQSYVIDVNGWSFVKDNSEYYDKAASILKSMFIREKLRWEGRTTPSETDSKELAWPQTSDADKSGVGLNRKPTASKDYERGNHRQALKSVFRSRSISQLRENVSNAAHKMGHPQSARTASGTTSPITSTPRLERTPSYQKQGSQDSISKDELPPPAVSTPLSHLKDVQNVEPEALIDGAAPDLPADVPSTLPAPAMSSQWKMKGMVAVIRHADRTPKQKFKFTFHTKPFVDLLKGHQEEVLLVGEAALHSVQAAVREAMRDGVEDMTKLRILQNALAKKGGWPGTKVQIKPLFKKPKDDKDKGKEKNGKEKKEKKAKEQKQVDPSDSVPIAGEVEEESIERWKSQLTDEPRSLSEQDSGGPTQVRAQTRSDSLSEVTMSRAAAADNNLVLDKLQLVMKWGGEPTHSARYQAADLGENMRNDLLLMNRDVLADVSIFTSSERRVTTSAQIFAGAFLDQEDVGDDQIKVRKDLLDDSNAAKDEMDRVKKQLKGLLRQGHHAPEQFAWPKNGTPEPYVVVRNVVELMKFHRRVMRYNFTRLQTSDAMTSLEKIQSPSAGGAEADFGTVANGPLLNVVTPFAIQARWCTGEDAELFKERWEKLFSEFTDAEKVDPSKISELYDTMKFDALHNRQFLEWVFTPSQGMLMEDEQDRGRMTRTESTDARAEFAHTHKGTVPTGEVKDEENGRRFDAPSRSGTGSTIAYGIGLPADRERHSISHRLGLRRKSGDLVAVANNALKGLDESYFNLYRGSVSADDSKVRNDTRLEKLNELYGLSKILFDYIGPQEYGITNAEKLEIGLLTSLPLLREIVKDLEEVQASDDSKSFIYFTKESHIYTLLNCILEGGIQTKIARNAIPELDYLSQICFELYESENAEADIDPSNPDSNFNYSIRISISPGCHTFDPLDVQLDSKHCIGCAPRRTLMPHANWKEVLETLRAKFHTVKLPKSFTAVNLSEKIPQAFTEDEESGGLDDMH